MSRLEDNFRKVEPYVPGEQPNLPDMVKLNTNENPYPPSPKVAEALQKFELDSLRLYPDPASTDLVNALGRKISCAGRSGVYRSRIPMMYIAIAF